MSMRSVVIVLAVMFAGGYLHAEDGWQQCCTDHWLKHIDAPRSSDAPAQEAICVAYTLPTGGIMALPYGLDPARLPRDEVIRDISERYQAQVGASLFIAANVPLDSDYSYDAAGYCMFSTVETLGPLSAIDPNLVSEANRDLDWRSFIEVVTVEVVVSSEGTIETRSRLEWVEVLGTVPFAYDPNRFNDPPERQLWDPQHQSDRAFHIAWQGMMRWPSGEGLTPSADNPEKKPYSEARYQGTQLASLRFFVPDPQTWKQWNPGRGDKPGADDDTQPRS